MPGTPPNQQIFEQNPAARPPGHELSLPPATNYYPGITNQDPNIGSFLFNLATNNNGTPANEQPKLVIDLTLGDHPIVDLTQKSNDAPVYELPPTTFDAAIFNSEEFDNIIKQRMPTAQLYYITCMKMLYACGLEEEDFEDAALTIEEVLVVIEDERKEGQDVKKLRVQDVNKQRQGLGSNLVKVAVDVARQQFDEFTNLPNAIEQLISTVEQIDFGSKAIKDNSLAITVVAIINPGPLLDAYKSLEQ